MTHSGVDTQIRYDAQPPHQPDSRKRCLRFPRPLRVLGCRLCGALGVAEEAAVCFTMQVLMR